MNNNNNNSRATSSVSILRSASYSFSFQPLPVDPRPPPIPRPTRDSSDSLGEGLNIRSSVAQHPTQHGVRGRGQRSVRNTRDVVPSSGSSTRNAVGSEHRHPYFGHHDKNRNRRRSTMLHQHPTDASSHLCRQGQHRTVQAKPSYARCNNHYSRANSNDNRYPRPNGNQRRYIRPIGSEIGQSCGFGERYPHNDGSHYGLRHSSRPWQDRNGQHHRSDARITNHNRHGSSWQAPSREGGQTNGIRTEHLVAHGNNSMHSNGRHRPISNVSVIESGSSESYSVLSSRRSTAFRDTVVERAMNLLIERRSEMRVAEDDSFAMAVDQSTRPHRGATQSEVSQLPALTVDQWRRRASRPSDASCSEVCIICTEHFSADATVTVLPCGHAFHRDCVGTWLAIRRTCPMCRQEL